MSYKKYRRKELDFRAWVFYGEKLEKPHYSEDWESLSKFFEDHDENDDNQCIEQFTGLKDKNGKKIYIGDIVSEHQGDIIGKIVQNPSGEYRIAWLGIYGGDSALYVHHSLCEVIGNIHENGELLEEK